MAAGACLPYLVRGQCLYTTKVFVFMHGCMVNVLYFVYIHVIREHRLYALFVFIMSHNPGGTCHYFYAWLIQGACHTVLVAVSGCMAYSAGSNVKVHVISFTWAPILGHMGSNSKAQALWLST